MIYYESGGLHFILKIFRLKGSVFLHSLAVAVPCAGIACVLKVLALAGAMPSDFGDVVLNNAAWTGFSVLVGFLIIFRTSQSYLRFWEGCTALHSMRAQWFDACSAVVAFCKYSTADEEEIRTFQELLVRLFSMLHAAALGEIEGTSSENIDEIQAFRLELLDVQGVDEESLVNLMFEERKVQLIYQWIQNLMVSHMRTGILEIPPPILTRAFGQLAGGMVAFHDASKLADVPFPFPYAQMCDSLLLMHWLIVPWVVYPWVTSSVWAFIFCFIQVFILWSLNFIAVEIEHPFGVDDNDLDGRRMQKEMNMDLRVLVRPHTIQNPKLKRGSVSYHDWQDGDDDNMSMPAQQTNSNSRKSFKEVWDTVDASRHKPLNRLKTPLRAKKKPSQLSSLSSMSINRVSSESGGSVSTYNSVLKLDSFSASLLPKQVPSEPKSSGMEKSMRGARQSYRSEEEEEEGRFPEAAPVGVGDGSSLAPVPEDALAASRNLAGPVYLSSEVGTISQHTACSGEMEWDVFVQDQDAALETI